MKSKYWWLTGMILVTGFVKVVMTPWVFHVDMLSTSAWGEWIYQKGPASFYEHGVWSYSAPTQPPLISLVFAFNKYLHIQLLGQLAHVDYVITKFHLLGNWGWLHNLVWWYAYGIVNIEIGFQIGYMVTMKFLPILADVGIAVTLFVVDPQRRLRWPVIYLLSPFSWYLSALWGQYDQVAFVVAWWAMLAGPTIGIGLYMASVLLKPTELIFGPLAGIKYALSQARWWQWLIGMVLAAAIFYWSTLPFANRPVIDYWHYTLKERIFEKSEPRISTNSLNFWHIIIGNKARNQATLYAGLQARYWSLAAVIVLNCLAAYHLISHQKSNRITTICEAMFLVGAGTWLFGVGMLERYYFAGVTMGLAVCIFRPQLLKYWWIMSIIFWINLYLGWWYPSGLAPFQTILEWQEGIVTRVLAVIQVMLFVIMAKDIVRPTHEHTT